MAPYAAVAPDVAAGCTRCEGSCAFAGMPLCILSMELASSARALTCGAFTTCCSGEVDFTRPVGDSCDSCDSGATPVVGEGSRWPAVHSSSGESRAAIPLPA